MTQKQILKKLIAHYSMVIRLCRKAKGNDTVWETVCKTHTQFGLCSASLFICKESISLKKWLNENMTEKYGRYWYETPADVNTKGGVIRCLKYRLDKMNEILNSLNKK